MVCSLGSAAYATPDHPMATPPALPDFGSRTSLSGSLTSLRGPACDAAALPRGSLSSSRTSLLNFIDPRSKTLTIERSAVEETVALEKDEPPTLCLLHMAGRCWLGPRCRQLHADVAVVSKLRREALARPDCCAAHGDSAKTPVPAGLRVQVAGIVLREDQLCMTAGLATRTRHGPRLEMSDICRVHLGGLCRYGDGCRFVHVCREIEAVKLAVPPMRSEVMCAPKRAPEAVPYRNDPYHHNVVLEEDEEYDSAASGQW